MGGDNLEDGDEEAEDWDWEEVDVLVPCVRIWTSADDEGEDLICSRVEDEVGECVLDGGVDAVGAVGDEEKREQGEEEAEEWDWEEEEVVGDVLWKS